jgi:NAD(P)-dependent dehydrogenase (short-subunit alcohol dehydrogenase family)
MSPQQVILITGASAGIGRCLADYLSRNGFVVYGTSRNPSQHAQPSDWTLLQLDVCADPSVQECVNTVVQKSGRLDVLVNNAGYPLNGAIEEATLEQVKAQFETNFFGVVRIVKMVLPVMREQRSGHIINISTAMTLARVPFNGYYATSKCALEGFSEVLRQELKPLNIRVSVIRPGFFESNINASVQLGKERIGDYKPWRNRWLRALGEAILKAPAPDPIAECVFRAITSNRLALYYTIGKDVKWLPLLRWILPHDVFERVMKSTFKIPTQSI